MLCRSIRAQNRCPAARARRPTGSRNRVDDGRDRISRYPREMRRSLGSLAWETERKTDSTTDARGKKRSGDFNERRADARRTARCLSARRQLCPRVIIGGRVLGGAVHLNRRIAAWALLKQVDVSSRLRSIASTCAEQRV